MYVFGTDDGPRNRVFLRKDASQPTDSVKNPVSLVGVRRIAIALSYLEDPEDEIQRMGKPETESVVAGTRKKAVERCLEEAKGRKLLAVQHFHKNIWQCIFPGGEDEDQRYNCLGL